MPQILLVRRSLSEPGQFQVLLQRRSAPVSHPFEWCFPGGLLDSKDKEALLLVNPKTKENVLRRCALREICEEMGGAYFEKKRAENPQISHHFVLKPIQAGFLPPVDLGLMHLPPGLLSIEDNTENACINIGRNTFMYLMNASSDLPFHFDNWFPRATRKHRANIDESWTKQGRHGYVFVDFEAILNSPDRPVDRSSTPLVPYQRDLCLVNADYIRSCLLKLVASQDADMDALSAASLSINGSSYYGHSRVLSPMAPRPRHTSIPKGSYLRLSIDEECYRLVEHVTATIHSYFPTIFYSQLDESAGLGCHPFHITVCSGLGQTQVTVEQLLENILPRVASQFCAIRTTMFHPSTGKLNVRVTRNGRVLLKIYDLSHCLQFGQSLYRDLDGASFWYCECAENLHITIGSIIGTNSAKLIEFENWFNNIFAVHLPVSPFPCRSDFVEVSEECSSVTDLPFRYQLLPC